MGLKKNLKEIGHCFNLQLDSLQKVTSAAFDSRKIEKGGLFFALKGKRCDGHDFLKEVSSKGALAAVVSKSYLGPDYGLFLLPVEDVRSSLQELAKQSYRENPTYVIAITGTVGKTTTKEFVATLLSERYKVAKSTGSVNSQVGLPLMLLNCSDDIELLVLEMGMSLPGELNRLTQIVPPNFGALIKISLVHSENFENLEAIAEAKMELFRSEKTQEGLFNLETMNYQVVQEANLRKTCYSLHDPRADYFLKIKGDQLIIVEKGKESPPLKVSFEASHLLENFLCAVAIARMHGLNWDEVKRGASKIEPYLHRFQIFKRNGVQFIDDSYNASLASMKAALNNLPKGKKTIALLGSMKELGKFSISCHEEVARSALPIIDHLLCIGEETEPMIPIFREAHKHVEKVSSIKEAKERLEALAKRGDVVLIKGSNSLQLWKVLE